MGTLLEYIDFINESLDNPYKITEDKTLTNSDRENIFKKTGTKDYREYNIDAPKFENHHHVLSVYHRNGAYEIHHELEHPDTGVRSHSIMIGNKPNPRFVATMFHHAKSLIDDGHSVRIVGHKDNGMFDHYHRIGKALARRSDYKLTQPIDHSETTGNDTSNLYKEFTVSKQ